MKKIFTILMLYNMCLYSQITPSIVNQKKIGGINVNSIVNYGSAIFNNNDITIIGTIKATDGDVIGNHNNSRDIWIVDLDSSLNIKWQKSLGGSSTETYTNFKQTTDSGYIIIGTTTSSDGDITNYYGNTDIFVVKLDKYGQIQWKKTLGGTNIESARDIVITYDNGYLISASTSSTNGMITNNHGGSDSWLIKLDLLGNILWQKCFGGINSDGAAKLIGTNTGYLMAFKTSSNDADAVNNHGGTDVLVIYLDFLGNKIWQKIIGGSVNEDISSIGLLSNNDFILSGNTTSSDGDMFNNTDTSNVWLSKIDINGNITWIKFYPSKYETIMGVYKTNSNNYVIATTGTKLDGINNYYGSQDLVFTSVDTNGITRWRKNFGGTRSDLLRSVQVLSDGSLLVSSVTQSNNYDVSGHHDTLTDDIWLMRISIEGVLMWQLCIGGSTNDGWDGAIAQEIGNNIYIHCTTTSNDGDIYNPDFKQGFWIAKLPNGKTPNQIFGRIYSDLNANNKPDASDIFLDNIKIQATKNGNTYTYISSDTGRFLIYTDTGAYTIQPISNFANFSTIPISQTITRNTYGNKDTIHFKLAPTALVNDASILLSNNWITRPNRNGTYTLSYTNESGQSYNGTIKLKLDSRLTFQNATPNPTTIVGDTMIWNITNLPLFTTKDITINFLASATLVANDSLKSFAKIYNTQTDVTPNNNQYTLNNIVRASYDPNNKEVNKNTLTPTEAAQSPYLYYTIHFQNVGNDTAFDIYIKDTLDNNLDWSTFQPITASHKYNLEQKNNRYISFDFKDIQLVDSTTNEKESHGFIVYKIKTKNNLVAGNSINNRASIIFDLNAPIVTNKVSTIIQLLSMSKNDASFLNNINIYPNPTNDFVTLQLNAKKKYKF